MSGTDTPPELDIDLSNARGDVVFMKENEDRLSEKDGLDRMRTFVRRFKRKGGENGTAGDFEQLVADLLVKAGEEVEEATLRAFLEGGQVDEADVDYSDI